MSFKIQREEEQRDNTQQQHTPSAPRQESWERDTLYKLLLSVHKEQRSSRFWRNVWRGVGAMLFAGTLFTFHSCTTGRLEAESGGGFNKILGAKHKEHTAVIKLNGVIGSGYQDQVAMLRNGLEAAYADKNVKGIIIRANSPGGSPVISNTAFNEIRRLKEQHKNIPLYLVAEDMCASGCYYIAAAADKIYADPSSLVGSIGVIGGSFDFTELMDKLGIKRRLRTAGSNKGMGDPFSPETPEQTAIWQKMLDDIHGEFINAVKTGRGSRLKTGDPEIFKYRIYTGLEAQKNGLIDGFGNIYSVARDQIKAPELVDYTPDEDDLARAISRRLNSEVQNQVRQSLQNLDNKGW
ncbi:S49 family peptidase [Kingella potus]|uniref:S49 family peptidase n=1 Tax=Kingella potus TaxID=265175 RepID=UPI001FD35FCA|nr:S49 family peptidase [Kingella potus]UOP00787.1 S49 family peptidase [Kingella potus]